MKHKSKGQPPMLPKAFILLEGSRMGTGQLYVQAAKHLGLQPIVLSADPAQYDYLATENVELRWFAAEPGLKEPTSIIACRPYQAGS